MDEFVLTGAPIVFRFVRKKPGPVTGLMLNEYHERWIAFIRTGKQHS
jgi:hypothetical protein